MTTGIDAIEPSVRSYLLGAGDLPFFLPCRRAPAEPITWYGCASDESRFSAMVAEIGAFIGLAWPDFAGTKATLRPGDPVERELQRAFGTTVVCFRAVDENDDTRIVAQLRRFIRLLQKRPPFLSLQPLSFRQLRARFDRALLTRDERELWRL